MRVTECENHRDLRPLKLPLEEQPHIAIEPSMVCNLRCAACYNADRRTVKPLAQVKAEVDFARRRRNLETVSILGGEPTLYPHLTELIRYIKGEGLVCQVLTNGVTLAAPGGGRLLDELVAAGLDRLVLHADQGQGRSDEETDLLCRTIMTRCDWREIPVALSVTIYNGDAGVVPRLMRRYAPFRSFDGILTTQARDMGAVSGPAQHPSPDLGEVHRHIRAELKVDPATYVPSSVDNAEVCWLTYFYYMNTRTGATLAVSPRQNRLFRRLYRAVVGRHFFARTMSRAMFLPSLVLTLLTELVLDPRRLPAVLRLLRRSDRLRALRFQYILLQSGPAFNAGSNGVQICYHCPDATVRNGKIIPVCLADRLSPLRATAAGTDGQQLRAAVLAHMAEA